VDTNVSEELGASIFTVYFDAECDPPICPNSYDLIIVVIMGEGYKFRSSSLW
jgi:hypothetical protein